MSKNKAHINFYNIIFTLIVFVYILMMFKILFFKIVSPMELFNEDRATLRSLSLIPLDSIRLYMNGTKFSSPTAVLNVLGNILIFIPFGTFLMIYSKDKKPVKIVLATFIMSIGVEIIQFIFALGVTDIDDIILNTIGGLAGVFFYQILRLLVKDDRKIKFLIVCLVAVSVIFYIGILAYASSQGLKVKILKSAFDLIFYI